MVERTWTQKIDAILSSGKLGRDAEREMLESLRIQISRGADPNTMAWNWKALIDKRYGETVNPSIIAVEPRG